LGSKPILSAKAEREVDPAVTYEDQSAGGMLAMNKICPSDRYWCPVLAAGSFTFITLIIVSPLWW
jgi:hypothetical protein